MTDRRSALLIVLLVVLVHGAFAPWKGFYMDDWRFLQLWESATSRSPQALMTAFNVSDFCYYRPLDIPYFSLQYWIFGRLAWAYQLLQLALHAAAAVLLYAAWRRASGDAALALIAAAVFAVYPNHSSTLHWLSVPFAATAAAFAGALLLQLSAASEGRILPAILSAALLAAAVLTYEAVLPLVVLMPALSVLSLRREGRSSSESRRRALAAFAPCLLAALAVAAYQQVLIPQLFPLGQSRPMALDALHALKAYGRAFECSSTALLALLGDALRRAWQAGLWPLALGAPALAAAALGTWRALPPADNRSLREDWEWPASALAAWAASYAPVAVSAQGYMPHVFDEQNRLNAAGTVGASMLLAWLLRRAAPARPATARAAPWLLAGFLSLSALIGWVAGWDWARSWRLQTRILSGLVRETAAIQGPASIVLDAPRTIGNAPVFHADWEFDCALKVATGRRELQGFLVPPESEPKGPVHAYRAADLTP